MTAAAAAAAAAAEKNIYICLLLMDVGVSE